MRRFGVVIGILFIVLLLVMLRTTGNKFRPNAEKWAEPSFSGANFISDIESLPGKKLIIDLGGATMDQNLRVISVESGSVLQKEILGMIRRNDGPVVIASQDPSEASRVWMILSQMGIKNLYILGEKGEILLNEIRPDSSGLIQ